MDIVFEIGNILFGWHGGLSAYTVAGKATAKESGTPRETQKKQHNTRHGCPITGRETSTYA